MIRQLTDLQKLGLDTYKGSVEKYSVKEAEGAIRNAILDVCGGEWNMYSFMDNKGKVFQIMAEVLTVATGSLAEESFGQFTETKNTAMGDTPEFIVQDNSLFRVSTIASGTNDLRRQKLYDRTLQLSAFKLGVKIYTEFDLFMSGRVNWTEMVNRVAKSFNHQVAVLVYKAIYDSYSALTAPYQVNGVYQKEKLVDAIAHVESETGQKVKIYGTKKSLSKVLDATTVSILSEDRKNQILDFGYLKDFEGTPMIELPQGHIAGTNDFAIDDSFLLIVPDGEKIVKLLFEGDAYVAESTDAGARNDQQLEYLFGRKLGLGVLKSDIYSIYRIG